MIVPDFGGFIAHHVEARYDADEKLWLPPFRTLGFNQQLRLNDSLLAQSYVDAYDMSYPDALRQIENEVEELKDILNAEERDASELPGIGEIAPNGRAVAYGKRTKRKKHYTPDTMPVTGNLFDDIDHEAPAEQLKDWEGEQHDK